MAEDFLGRTNEEDSSFGKSRQYLLKDRGAEQVVDDSCRNCDLRKGTLKGPEIEMGRRVVCSAEEEAKITVVEERLEEAERWD
jgi:hypothetical protein